jgi:hypothetical protein
LPSKEYRIWLTDRAYIAVEFVMIRGRVVSFVVRLMLIGQDREVNVARYDTAHGAPHRDVLGQKGGLLQKTWYLDSDLGDILRVAVDDFLQHHDDYIQIYEAN